MNYLDLADLVALAGEVSEVEAAKLVALLDQAEVEALLVEARASAPPHEAAAAVLVGLMTLGPLPTGGRRLALLAALLLLSRNGLDVDLEPGETQALMAGVGAGRHEASTVTEWLSTRVTACDPLEGALRHRLGADAWQAVGGAVFRAYRHGRRLATPADLLMGIFREGTGPGARALGAAEGERQRSAPQPVPNVPARLPAFEPETRRAIERGFRSSIVLGHHQITTGHLLLGLLDAGHVDVLPDNLHPDEVRRRVLDLLGPGAPAEGDLAGRLTSLASRIRTVDPAAADELDEVADLQRIGLDRLMEMVRAWRGELFLDAMAGEPVIARLLGPHRLGPAALAAIDEQLLDTYLADIAQYPKLTRAEEAELAQSIRSDTAAEGRRRLVESNLHLVVAIARTYEASGVPMLDLIQKGNLGLTEAANHFDPRKGFRFASFACWWIRKYILEAIARRPP